MDKLDLSLAPRALANLSPKEQMRAILLRWLPVSAAVMDMVVTHLPSPAQAQASRINRIWPGARDLKVTPRLYLCHVCTDAFIAASKDPAHCRVRRLAGRTAPRLLSPLAA